MTNFKIVFLGGMSESGKSYTGQFLESQLNFKRIKIIALEKELMTKYNIKIGLTKPQLHNSLETLYQQKNIFADFYAIIKERSENKNVVLESLYRSELFLGIKKIHPQTFCIFMEASKENRLNREYEKEGISFESLKVIFEEKEAFKIEHKAHLVRDVANIIVNNDGTKEQLHRKIIEFLDSLN